MERMLVVIFDNEPKAYDGSTALSELDSKGSISIHGKAVIEKNADGTVTVNQKGEDFPVGTLSGTAVGALIGLLGGPVGLGVGALAGTVAGGVLDMSRAGINADFLDEVSDKLTPGKWAIVADISEEREIPVDARMAALGGTVFRATRQNVEDDQDAKDVAALKANVAQLKVEQANSRAEEKAKIQLKIDNLNGMLHVKLEQARQRSKQREEEATAKVEALEKKAAKAKGDAKAKIEARIAEIKEDYKKKEEAFDRWSKKNEEYVDRWMSGED
jgi:uncharacterized membrane protein